MTTTTRNLWYEANRGSMQPTFRYEGRPLFTYRDVQVFKSAAGNYDYVLAGATVAQRAGFSRATAPAIIDAILVGDDPRSSVSVREHVHDNWPGASLRQRQDAFLEAYLCSDRAVPADLESARYWRSGAC